MVNSFVNLPSGHVFKAGVKSEMGNYRPISVLSTVVARVFERLK